MRRRTAIVILLAILAAAASACAPTAGKHGELGFTYAAEDSIGYVSPRRALARGCQADIVAYASDAKEDKTDIVWGDEVLRQAKRIDVEGATSSNPQVLEVLGTDGARVRLLGKSVGASELHVVTAGGEDVIDVDVAETHRVELAHLAWESEKATPAKTVLMQGGTVHFTLSRKDVDGRRLACYEPAGAVDVEPADAVDIVNRDRDMGHLRLSVAAPERVSVVPSRGSGFDFETVSASDIRSVELDFVRGKEATGSPVLAVGKSDLFRVDVRSKDGRYVLGLDGALEVTSQTPQICETASLAQLTSDGLFAVRGLAAGTCKLSASLGDAAASRSIEIQAAP
ncbi:MAG: pilus assembly protein N-terminal domain-containing protein [Myxococcota bacterium]